MPISKEQELSQGWIPRATDLSSKELRNHPAWSQRVKDEAVFSARTTYQRYVEMLKSKILAVASRGVTPQKAEEQLQQALENIGYTPQRGFPGNDGTVPPAIPKSMTDLSSSRRIQLILDTNIKKARSLGQMAAGENPVFLIANPAWRLTRTGARKKPRGDWRERWNKAGASVAWKGAAKKQMVALKDSPIWEALGKGVGGYDDTVGSPFPPFAFGSGLAWVNVGKGEWERICRDEGIAVEQPKAPAPVSAGEVQKVDGETGALPKKDLPDYAQSPEFQSKLRDALAKMKAARERRVDAGQIASTDRPLPPPTGKDYGSIARAKQMVAATKMELDRRIRLIYTILRKHAEKVAAQLEDLKEKNPSVDLSDEISSVASAIEFYDFTNAVLRRDYDALTSYEKKLSQSESVSYEQADRLYRSADKMRANANKDYKLRNDAAKNVKEALSSAKEKIRAVGDDSVIQLFDRIQEDYLRAVEFSWTEEVEKVLTDYHEADENPDKEKAKVLDDTVDKLKAAKKEMIDRAPTKETATRENVSIWKALVEKTQSLIESVNGAIDGLRRELERRRNIKPQTRKTAHLASVEKDHPELSENGELKELKRKMELAKVNGDAKNFDEAYSRYVEVADKLWKPQTELEKKTYATLTNAGFNHTVAEQSVIQQTNPNYPRDEYEGQWTENCQRCVPAAEMIARGWKVTARPKPKGIQEDSISKLDHYHEVYLGGEKLPWKKKEDIEAKMSEWGDGARCIITFTRIGSGNSGHCFYAVQENGNTKFTDPQKGWENYSPWSRIPSRGRWTKNKTFMRVDNLEFNPRYVNKVASPIHSK